MNDPVPSPGPRGLPAGLLGMLVLVALVEQYVVRNDHVFGNIPAVQWRNARSLARKVKDCEILCLGSSLTTNSVQPQIIEAELGKKAGNLALFAGKSASSYFLLKHVIDSGARPRVLVLDCQDRPVESNRYDDYEVWEQVRLWPELLSLPECLDLAWTAHDPDFFAAMVVSKALPSARARYELRNYVVASLEGKSPSLLYMIAGHLRNWRLHRGAQVLAAAGQDREVSTRLERYPGRRELWRWSAVTESYTRRLLELAARHEIKVFWTLPPIGPRLTVWRDENHINAMETQLAQEAQSHNPGVTIIEGRRSQFPPRVFSDGLHLGRPGAIAYTRKLDSILARYFQDPRSLPKSLDLTPYQEADRATNLWLENINESFGSVNLALIKERKLR